MQLIRTALLAAVLLEPASLAAQGPAKTATLPVNATARDALRHPGGVNFPVRVGRTGIAGGGQPQAAVVAAAGTQVGLQPRWMGAACPSGGPGGGCLVAQGSGQGAPGLTIQMGDGSVRGSGSPVAGGAGFRVGATLLVPHDGPHTLRVSLDGSEVMGFSCNGRALRLQVSGGRGFRWEVYHGAQRVGGGASTGEAVSVPNPPHLAGPGGGPMQLTVEQRNPGQLAGADDAWCKKYGCLQMTLAHGAHRIVVMPVLERTTPFALQSLGLSVAGVPAFALAGVEVTPSGP